METKTYEVPEQNLAKLQTQMAKLQKRCARIKVAAPTLEVGEAVEEIVNTVEIDEFDQKVERTRVVRTYPVVLHCDGRPKINGYEFAAVLAPVISEDGALLGNVLRQVPGFEGQIPERFRNADNYCDHCKTKRFRLETFVIVNEAGFRQVGRNCLANYLGLQDPERFAEMAQILIDANDLMGMSEDDDFGGMGGGYRVERFLMSDVLEIAASAIRQYGWLSKKSAREFEKTATADRVSLWMMGNAKTRSQFEHPLRVSEEDKALAAETIEWLGTLGTPAEDYLYNLSLLAKSMSITGKNFGISVSAINAYSRVKEREIRRNARIESDKNSQFVGVIKERMLFENLIVLYTTTFEGNYGVTHFYKMKQGENIIVYFSSNDMGWAQGDTVAPFKACVKKHEVREEINQTVITRATMEPTAEEKAAAEQAKADAKAAAKEAKQLKKLMSEVAWG